MRSLYPSPMLITEMSESCPSYEELRTLLLQLQNHILDRVLEGRKQASTEELSKIAEESEADTIYQIDKLSEEAIYEWFNSSWPDDTPVRVIMEGVEDDDELLFYGDGRSPYWRCIIDPIDGTRGIMYDKRPAWILAAIAPPAIETGTLRDLTVAALTEIPTTKQWRSDQISAIRGQGPLGVLATYRNVLLPASLPEPFELHPSRATDFKHGFASLARFFPEAKAITAQFEEELWDRLYGLGKHSSPLVFDDQYMSTGGQIFELLAGHDRMIGDLRPLAHRVEGYESALVCHPYDICTALILEEAGGIVETPQGTPLNAPLDTTSPVAWVGYANHTLAEIIRPHMKELCEKYFTS